LTTAARTIRASDLVKDVESGLNDFAMMERYGITAKQLEYLLHRLVDAGLVTTEQLHARMKMAETAVTKAFVSIHESIEELE